MDKLKINKEEFMIRKLTRKDRKELLAEGIDINLLEVKDVDLAFDRIFSLCISEKDQKKLDELSIGEEEELLDKIVKVSRGIELTESEKNS